MTDTLMRNELRLVQQQIAALQRAAQRRHRVTVTPVQPQPWLGQAVTLWVQVMDEGGEQARIDLPVLVTTTWGRLRVADGYTGQEGESIVARTDLNGVLLLTLLPPLAEELGEPPRRALETLLAQLDPTASTPAAILPVLTAIVAHYQQATEQDLRTAVDFYVQHFYQPRLATVSAYDWLQSWQYSNATVTVLAPEATAGEGGTSLSTTVQGAAVLTLRFKDWVGPWLQRYINLARDEGNLRRQFALLTELTKNPEEVVAATADLVQTAVRNQMGWTGEFIEQQVVYGVVTALLDQDTQELPVATRVKLLTGLPAATDTVRRLGSRAGTNLGQAAADLKQDLTQTVDSKVGQLQVDLRDVQEELKRRPGFQLIQELQATIATLSTTLTTLTSDVTTFRDQVNLRLTDSVTRTELTQVRTDFGRVLATKIDQRQLEQSFGEWDERFRNLQTDLSAFSSNVTRLRGDLDTLGNHLSKLRVDVDKIRPRP